MKGLLTKDFQSEKITILMTILAWTAMNIILYGLIKVGGDKPMGISFMNIVLVPVIVMQDLLKNEKDTNSMSYLLSLPISKKLYVNEKLIFSIFLILLIGLSNFVSLGIVSYLNHYNIDIKEFLNQTIFYTLTVYLIINIGLNFSVNMGYIGFNLSSFFVLVLVLIFISTWMAITSLVNLLLSGYQIVLAFLVYVAFNEWIRRSTIKKMKKKRY